MKQSARIFFLLLSIPAFSQSLAAFPPLEADSRAAEYARRGNYSWRDLAEISLWASVCGMENTPPRAGAAEMEIIAAGVEELKAAVPASEREKAEYILGFLHRKYFKTYSVNQTRMDLVLSTGRFNCVSSAVLYTIFASALGIKTGGVATRDHAFVTVYTSSGAIDVETTNPYGFDPGNRREFHDGFGKLTGFVYVPARNYRDRYEVNQLELISLIFTNRITELEKQNRYADAIPLAVNRMVLLSGSGTSSQNALETNLFPEPKKTLMDRLINHGASLLNAGREIEALEWAEFASSRYPDSRRWRELTYTALNNHIGKLVNSRRLGEARELIASMTGRVSPGQRKQLENLITDFELVDLSRSIKNEAQADTVLEAIATVEKQEGLGAERIKELRVFCLLKKAEFIAAARGWNAAIAFTSEAIRAYGSNTSLEEGLRIFRSNRISELHNRFATAFNNQRLEEAREIVRKALEEFPDNRQLLADRDLAERAARRLGQ